MSRLAAIILAAGQGIRMRSKLAKVLHPACGRPMVLYAVDLAETLAKGHVAVVVGYQAERVKDLLTDRKVTLVEQARRLGTGHAVVQAQAAFQGRGGNEWSGRRFVILSGDTPLLTEATVRALLATHEPEPATVNRLTAHLDQPTGYGRIVRGRDGTVWRIIEDKDATPAERRLTEVNAGTYVVEGECLFPALIGLKSSNAQKEHYLTDIVEAAIRQGRKVAAYIARDSIEALGVNTRAELAEAERVLRDRVRRKLMEAGATFLEPETCFVDPEVRIGCDTVIHPHTTLDGRTVIGEDCVIRSHSRLVESVLGDGVTVLDSCVIEGSRLEEECTVGPFAHLRPGNVIKRGAKVGNFVELKKTELGPGAKANHLSYLGDAQIGSRVNIGAGTITCNYDGHNKHQTVIGDDAFVGSDVSLVAPVTVGRGAGIGHTRWATHGKPSEQNAHPHRSGPLVLVHNGIIENYGTLKASLQQEGYRFESETDTEVMAHLIARHLKDGRGLEGAVRAATKEVRGGYAIAVLCEGERQTIIAARSGGRLVVGMAEPGPFAAPDVTGILATAAA